MLRFFCAQCKPEPHFPLKGKESPALECPHRCLAPCHIIWATENPAGWPLGNSSALWHVPAPPGSLQGLGEQEISRREIRRQLRAADREEMRLLIQGDSTGGSTLFLNRESLERFLSLILGSYPPIQLYRLELTAKKCGSGDCAPPPCCVATDEESRRRRLSLNFLFIQQPPPCSPKTKTSLTVEITAKCVSPLPFPVRVTL